MVRLAEIMEATETEVTKGTVLHGATKQQRKNREEKLSLLCSFSVALLLCVKPVPSVPSVPSVPVPSVSPVPVPSVSSITVFL